MWAEQAVQTQHPPLCVFSAFKGVFWGWLPCSGFMVLSFLSAFTAWQRVKQPLRSSLDATPCITKNLPAQWKQLERRAVTQPKAEVSGHNTPAQKHPPSSGHEFAASHLPLQRFIRKTPFWDLAVVRILSCTWDEGYEGLLARDTAGTY